MAASRGRAAESRAKAAIYGGGGADEQQEHHGKRMVPGAGGGSGAPGAAPFATFAAGMLDEERYPSDFLAAAHKGVKPFAAKVGSEAFGSDVYLAQAQLRHAIDAQSRAKNSGGPSPYAAEYEAGSPYPKGYALAPREKGAAAGGGGGGAGAREPTGKVGAGGSFDAGVYVSHHAEAAAVAESIRAKKHGGGAPFATFEGMDELRRRECYVAKAKRNGSAAGKPWAAADFDPEPYRAQLALNQATAATSTQRNFVGSGDILANSGSRQH